MPENRTFPERLKSLRESRKLSQTAIAKKINISQSVVARWESGDREPTLAGLRALASVFGVTTDYLLGLTDNPLTAIPSETPYMQMTPFEKLVMESYRELMPREQAMICRQLGLEHPAEARLRAKEGLIREGNVLILQTENAPVLPPTTREEEPNMPKKEKKLLRSRINVEPREGFPPVYKWCQGWTPEELRRHEDAKRAAYADTLPRDKATRAALRKTQRKSPKPAEIAAPTFEEAAEAWFDTYKAPHLRPSTIRMYRALLDHQIYPVIGDIPIDRITRQDLQYLFNQIADMSASTIRKAKLTLQQVFENAIEDGQLERTPLRRLTIPRGTQKAVRPIRPDAVTDLAAACLADEDGLFPLLLLYSGLRRGEALALTWADITDTEIRVNKALSWYGNKPTISAPKTAAGIRAVPLLPIVRQKLGARGAPEAYVFGGETPWTSTIYRNTWARIGRHIPALAGVHPHQLRHTYTDILRHAGVDILAAQHLLGHEDYQTTATFYSTFDEVDKTDAENRLLQYLSAKALAPSDNSADSKTDHCKKDASKG